MPFQNAEVELQNDTLVVKNPATGNCALIELSTGNPHEPGSGEIDSVVNVFGAEVSDQPELVAESSE